MEKKVAKESEWKIRVYHHLMVCNVCKIVYQFRTEAEQQR